MRSEIELARARQDQTGELAAAAHSAREQMVTYRERTDSPKVASPARLRDLQRASELAELRLQRAQRAPGPEPADAAPGPGQEAGFRGETDDGVQFG